MSDFLLVRTRCYFLKTLLVLSINIWPTDIWPLPVWNLFSPGVCQLVAHYLCSHCLPQWGLDHTPQNGKFWMSQNLNLIIYLSDLTNSGSFHHQSVTCGACGGDYSGGRRQWARSSWIWPGGLCEEPSPTCICPQNWCPVRPHKSKVGQPIR